MLSEINRTLGQIQSFKKYLTDTHHKNIAVVSSAYHIPRVARTIGNESPQVYEKENDNSKCSTLNLFLFGIHKQEKRCGIIHDVQGEHLAMKNYSSGNTPTIARLQSNNTFFNECDLSIIKRFNRSRFWYSFSAHLVKSCLFATKNNKTIGVLRLIEQPGNIEHDVACRILS